MELRAVAAAVTSTGVDVLVVGKGSNLLVADAGFPGLAIVLGDAFAGVDVDGTTVRAGGAAALPVVARRTVAAGLAGFEWAVGVPGSVGGGVRMNAGGHGADLAASLVGVRIVDLRTGEDGAVPAAALDLGYRRSAVEPHQIVVTADLALTPGDPDRGAELLAEIVAWRRANQPGGPNAGSVFANPEGDAAARLIDEVGVKGLRVGTAQVSTKHANFIQADDGGRADDVYALMGEVHERVRAATGVALRPETRCVGFPTRTLDWRWRVELWRGRTRARPSHLRTPPVDPRIRARRVAVRRDAGRRRLRRLRSSGSVLVVLVGFVGALRSPLLDVDAVRVAGTRRTAPQAVVTAAGIEPGEQLVDLDLGAAGARVAALPWVGEVHIHRALGGAVDIRVVERDPGCRGGRGPDGRARRCPGADPGPGDRPPRGGGPAGAGAGPHDRPPTGGVPVARHARRPRAGRPGWRLPSRERSPRWRWATTWWPPSPKGAPCASGTRTA